MKVLTATEVARHFSTVLDSVEHGETVVVTRAGRQIASIEPKSRPTGRALKDFLRTHDADPDWGHDVLTVRDLLNDRGHAWPDD